jgi:hypothetical protein
MRTFDSCLRCKCELCAPHVTEDSPQASDDSGDSSDSGNSPEEVSNSANANADAIECKQQTQLQLEAVLTVHDSEAAAALLRSQKREAIRIAVEAQRAELNSGQR